MAVFLMALGPYANAQLDNPLFAGTSITIHGTTFSWSADASSESGGMRTDLYLADDYSMTVQGNSNGQGIATVQGNAYDGAFSGFFVVQFENNHYLDAVQITDISGQNQSFNNHTYQGVTQTLTYSLATDGTLASQTVATYQTQETPSVSFAATYDGSGNGTISGNESGFIRSGAWYVNQTTPISGNGLGFNLRSYPTGIRTVNYSLDGSNNLVTQTVDTYTTQDGSNNSFTVTFDANGNGIVSGSENGYYKNGNWYVNTWSDSYGPFMSPPSPLFGNTYSFSSGGSGTTYDANLNATNSQYASFNGSLGGSCSISKPTFDSIVTISGYDPAIGSFSGNYYESGWTITSPRTDPSFAPRLLWNSDTVIRWKSGTVDMQTGYCVDTYKSDDNSITVLISGNLQDYVTSRTAQVQVGSASGTFDANAQRFYINYELQVRDGNRHTPVFIGYTSIWVNGSEYVFNAGWDGGDGSSTDTYTNSSLGTLSIYNPGGASTTQVTVTYFGLTYTGTFNGSFNMDATNFPPVTISPLQDNLVGGAPDAFWVDGVIYKRIFGISNVYTGDAAHGTQDHWIVISGSSGNVQIAGSDGSNTFTGSFTGNPGMFSLQFADASTRFAYPANSTGSAQLSGINAPGNLPPGAFVPERGVWQFLGTVGSDSFYGAAARVPVSGDPTVVVKTQYLIIDASNVVTLVDTTGTQATATGHYDPQTGLFASSVEQPLPMLIYAVDPCSNGTAWTPLSTSVPTGRPSAVLVADANGNNQTWLYGGTDNTTGNSTYYGYYPNQTLTIAPAGRDGVSTVTLSDAIGGNASGTYYNGSFTLNASRQAFSGRFNGSQVATVGATNLYTMNSDLDITGNVISLGSWYPNGSTAGLTLQYSEQFRLPGATDPSASGNALIYLTGSRQNTSWLWNHAASDGGSANVPMMLLAGADHSLTFYDQTATTPTPTIILNPSGRSRFDKPIRIAPQGDLDMGEFVHGPGEPQ